MTIDYGYNQDHQRTSAAWSDDTFLPSGLAAASPAYAPNALNQYATVAAVTYGYDANGNLTSDGVWTYGYDSENRLVSAKRTAAPAVTATYGYDPLGRRRSKTVNGVVTRWLSVGDQEIAEYTGSTPVLDRRYVYGLGLDEPLATVVASSGAVSYHLTDGLGSVIALVTNAAGVVSEKHGYTAYGAQPAATGTAFQFAGRRLDPETGLYHNRARAYSPVLGRFLQADPIGIKGGLNLYAYVGNDPANLVDPSGLMASDVVRNTLDLGVPGLHYFNQSGEDWNRGDYGSYALNQAAGFADVGLAIVTGGSSKLGTAAFRTGAQAVETGAKPFAMGLEQGLDAFADARGATTWKNLSDPMNWKSGVIDKLADSNTMVHFNLDGVDVWGGVTRAASGRGGATDWELMQIRQNSQWWDTLQFWKNGSPASNPFGQ